MPPSQFCFKVVCQGGGGIFLGAYGMYVCTYVNMYVHTRDFAILQNCLSQFHLHALQVHMCTLKKCIVSCQHGMCVLFPYSGLFLHYHSFYPPFLYG